jgi:uncharacterized protein YggU (UPF0235/DUF167 family)
MYIRVRVIAGAKEEHFAEKTATHFNLSVREEAKQNLANKRVLEIIADHFKVSKNKVRIISGHHSSAKILDIDVNF